ncbi:GNAT family N-acetyltransferase [Marisediminicola sp. LYQ134]|uniref:GNAT family N-acetyltransferase n=1 Tax=Marisediminicola sp. LYQ134 TaxID=3391061 RepID=UPI0039837539
MTDAPATELIDETTHNRFVYRVDGEDVGVADYQRTPGVIHIVHTEVDAHRRGAGVGGDMVRAILDRIRDESSDTVGADCPFVRSWLDDHPDYLGLEAR